VTFGVGSFASMLRARLYSTVSARSNSSVNCFKRSKEPLAPTALFVYGLARKSSAPHSDPMDSIVPVSQAGHQDHGDESRLHI